MSTSVFTKPFVRETFAFLAGATLAFGGTDFSSFEIVIGMIAVGTVWMVVKNNWYSRVPWSLQNYIVLGFAALVALQLLLQPTDTWFAIITLYLIGVYALVQFWSSDHKIVTVLTYGYVASALFSAAIGLATYSKAWYLGNAENLPFFWSDHVRLNVFFDDPVVYGAFLVPAILLLSCHTFQARSLRLYTLFTLLTLLLFSNLILTGSRGAWLNLLMGAGAVLLLYPPVRTCSVLPKITGVVALSLTLAVMLIFIIPLGGHTFYEATLDSRYQSSDLPRLEALAAAPEQLRQRDGLEIVFGTGSGSYEQSNARGFSAHNTYVRVLYEQGVLGITLYLAIIACVVITTYRQRQQQPLYVVLLIAVLAGILVHGLFVDTLHWRHFWVLIAFAR